MTTEDTKNEIAKNPYVKAYEKLRTATEDDLKRPWFGYTAGKGFRCGVCGHWFKPGETYRWVMANFPDSGLNYGNFLVCTSCDGPDLLDRHIDEADHLRPIRLFE